MRKIPVWCVEFLPKGVLDGNVNVAAESAENAIELVRGVVEQTAMPGSFSLQSVNPVHSDRHGDRLHVLWENDGPKDSALNPSEVEVEHEGKRYAAGASMPKMEIVSDSPEDDTPRDPQNTDADKQGAALIEQARKEKKEMIASGKIKDGWTEVDPNAVKQ